MKDWIIWAIVGVVALAISLFVEPVREFLAEQLSALGEQVAAFFTFQWVTEIPDFFGNMFEDLGSFSVYGVAFALIGGGMVFAFRGQMLEPFIQGFGPTGQVTWTVITYAGVILAGYLLGKSFENTA